MGVLSLRDKRQRVERHPGVIKRLHVDQKDGPHGNLNYPIVD
jgi:hypothetical protein